MKRETTRTWAEISLSSLAHNYHTLRACAPDSRFLGVVKANAYGHGAVEVARCLAQLGADYLAVACVDELMELRSAGITLPVLILGATPVERAEDVAALDGTQAVSTPELVRALSRAACTQGKRVRVHIKADTGMSRLGVLADEPARAAAEIAALCTAPGLVYEGIFTHFANADGDEAYTMLQFTRFLDLLDCLKELHGLEFEIRHCAASAAVLNYSCTHLDMVRPGIALYGYSPDPSCTLPEDGLRPVMSLKTRISAVRTLPGNTPVSYGCTAAFGPEGGRVAVAPIGYADGLHRVLSNKGSLWLAGQPRPIMGRVCMDMCMVGLDEQTQVCAGDTAEVFGTNLPLERLAELAGTIPYELLCAVAPRVPRVYLP